MGALIPPRAICLLRVSIASTGMGMGGMGMGGMGMGPPMQPHMGGGMHHGMGPMHGGPRPMQMGGQWMGGTRGNSIVEGVDRIR